MKTRPKTARKVRAVIKPPPAKKAPANAAPAKGARVKINKPPPEFAPHFKYGSRDAALIGIEHLARRIGCSPKAFHVLEEGVRYAIAPAHHKTNGAPPQFKKGETVFDIVIPNSRAKVLDSGPYQTELRYLTGMYAKEDRIIPNVYLTRLETDAPKVERAAPQRAKIKKH